jgi:hypothetical protein
MLRGNLATRPFYNDRAVTTAIVAAALLVAAFTLFNGTRLVSLTSRRASIESRTADSRTEAEHLRAQATAIQQGIDRASLARLAGSAREANTLIDRRTFSWTTLFSLLEKAMPMDVRLVSVSPQIERSTMTVVLAIVARDLPDIDVFIDALLDTGAFHDVSPAEKQGREDGTYTALVEGVYRPPSEAPGARAAAVDHAGDR